MNNISNVRVFHSTVTTERPVQVKVVKVKKSDKGDFYKRQIAWALRDLAVVDAKDAIKVWGFRRFLFFSLCSFYGRVLCLLKRSDLAVL